MKVTVIVCTYNRCQSLAGTLDSLAESIVPASTEWEVLIVDNNSSDRTRQVVEEFSLRFPGRFRYTFEPRQGKSFALNRGIRETQAEVLAFTDDDAIAEPTWLWNLTKDLFFGEWDGTGGRTLLMVDRPVPDWFTARGDKAIGGIEFDMGDESCDMKRPPNGVNMAFRREVFEHGMFREDLGPGITKPRSMVGEDVNIGYGVLHRGRRMRYEPDAAIRHPLVAWRVEKKPLLHFAFEVGRYQAIETERKPAVHGIPRRWLTLARLVGVQFPNRFISWALETDARKRFHSRYMLNITLGQAYELARS